MKKPLAILAGVVITLGLIIILHAQDAVQGGAVSLTDTNVDWNAMSDIQVELRAVESVPTMPAESLPTAGTFWSAQHAPGTAEEWPPLPIPLGMGAWSLGDDGVYLLDDLNHVYSSPKQSKNTTTSSGTMTTASVDLNPNDGSTNDGGGYNPEFFGTPVDTNGLWLQIFSVNNGTAYLSLNNATDQVYEVMSRTNLISPGWQTETELFPTDGTVQTNALPFTVPVLDRTNALFFRAMDWTGVTHGGNIVPDWWLWEYFGTTNLSDTNLDSEGDTLLDDYFYGYDPNVINFSPVVTNNYVNSMSAPVQLNVTAGVPSYYAVSVDDTNYTADASWQTYAGTNITVNLGLTQGWHDVWIALKGPAPNATVTWQYKRLKLDYAPPPLVITSPTNGTVNVPMIQVTGYSPEALSSISYYLTNALGMVTNQQVLITDQSYSTNTWEFTTNYFQCFDVPLTNGVNTFTFHATDLAGNVTTLTTNFTLDYSGKTNPPAVQITWPTNRTQISGTNFTLNGQLADPTANVVVQIVSTNGATNTISGLVERNGKFWVEDIPLSGGTNALAITVTDAVGNMSVTNISIIQSTLALTVNLVTPASQLWQSTVNLTGTISISTYAVWVNGVKGHNNGNGTWSASNVPVNSGGTASFTATAYAPTEQQPDGSYGN